MQLSSSQRSVPPYHGEEESQVLSISSLYNGDRCPEHPDSCQNDNLSSQTPYPYNALRVGMGGLVISGSDVGILACYMLYIKIAG